MLSAIDKALRFLNQYSNLLLVLVTIAYVWLTQRTLSALKEASLREREALHLEEIKLRVINPILSWIDGTVVARFTGRTPRLLALAGGYDNVPCQVCHTVDDPFTPRHRLVTPSDSDVPDELSTWTSTDSNRVSRFLYEHAKREHFSKELRQFDGLLDEVRTLIGGFTSFANDCAASVSESEIPRLPDGADPNAISDWTNPYLLVTECIYAFQFGRHGPSMELRMHPDSSTLETAGHQPVAKASDPDKLTHWYEAAMKEIRATWEQSKLPQETSRLLRNADGVRRNLEQLVFTHTLGVDCDLISGKKHNR